MFTLMFDQFWRLFGSQCVM